jgi:DNA-directed RNA polymerase subunit M/transcription elongation factor TFIIS
MENHNILDEINENNIFEILDNEMQKYEYIYKNDKDYIVYNLICLRYESKENREKLNLNLANKIDEFLKKNINEFKNININIFLKSPFFEEQIKNYNKENDEVEIIEEGVEICHECKSKRIIIRYMQIRSGDEGETGFFECSECGNKWKK